MLYDDNPLMESRVSDFNNLTICETEQTLMENEYLSNINLLREDYIIWKAAKYTIPPCLVLGLMANYLPYVLSVIPVHEADLCIC